MALNSPGFWDGIYFQSNSTKNILRNVVVTYAGAKGGLAAIRVMQNANLNAGKESSNRIHDHRATVVNEP